MINIDSSKPEIEKFKFPNYFWLIMALAVIFNLFFFALITFNRLIHTENDRISFYIFMFSVDLLFIALCFNYHKMSHSIIELTGEGIGLLVQNNPRVFLNWDELDEIKEERLMQRLVLFDKEKFKKINVDFQFDDFPHIQAKIFSEFEKRMKTPIFPMVFKSRFFTDDSKLIIFMLVFCVTIGEICAPARHMGKDYWSAFLGLLFIAPIALEFAYFYTPTTMTISETDIVFSYFFGYINNIVDFSEFVGVDLDCKVNYKSGNKFYYLVLSTKDGTTYDLTTRLGSIPKMYTILNRLISLKNNQIIH